MISVFILPSLPPGSRPRHPEIFGSFISNDLHSHRALLLGKARTEKSQNNFHNIFERWEQTEITLLLQRHEVKLTEVMA